MTSSTTRSSALELLTVIAYLVKQHKDDSKNILLSTHENILTFISDFVAEKEFTLVFKGCNSLERQSACEYCTGVFKPAEQCSNNQDYGEKAFEVLRAFALDYQIKIGTCLMLIHKISSMFSKVVVGSVEETKTLRWGMWSRIISTRA